MVAVSGLATLLNPHPPQHLFFGPLRFSESLPRLCLFLSPLYQWWHLLLLNLECLLPLAHSHVVQKPQNRKHLSWEDPKFSQDSFWGFSTHFLHTPSLLIVGWALEFLASLALHPTTKALF